MSKIISPTDFLHNGVLFYQNENGRCYRYVEPSGLHSRAARNGLLASKRVSRAFYNESLDACKRNMIGGAA